MNSQIKLIITIVEFIYVLLIYYLKFSDAGLKYLSKYINFFHNRVLFALMKCYKSFCFVLFLSKCPFALTDHTICDTKESFISTDCYQVMKLKLFI